MKTILIVALLMPALSFSQGFWDESKAYKSDSIIYLAKVTNPTCEIYSEVMPFSAIKGKSIAKDEAALVVGKYGNYLKVIFKDTSWAYINEGCTNISASDLAKIENKLIVYKTSAAKLHWQKLVDSMQSVQYIVFKRDSTAKANRDNAIKDYFKPFIREGLAITHFKMSKGIYDKGVLLGVMNFTGPRTIKYIRLKLNAINGVGDTEYTKDVRVIWDNNESTGVFSLKNVFSDLNDIIKTIEISYASIEYYDGKKKQYTKDNIMKITGINYRTFSSSDIDENK